MLKTEQPSQSSMELDLPDEQSEFNQNLIENENIVGNNNDCMPIGLSPVQIQQEYFENLGDGDWVKYEKSNRNYLMQNIAFALFGSPSCEGNLTEVIGDQNAHLEGYTSRQQEQVKKVYDKICEQSKYSYNDEDIVMSVILVVCARPKPLKFFQLQPADYWVDLHERSDIDIWCTAVFRVRTCIPTTVGAKSCRVYVDDNARVYHDWNSYLINNTLSKCVLIVPQYGEYKGTILEGEDSFAVKLSVVPSPSLGLKARVLSTVDTASTFASIGAIGVIGVAAFTPVGPAVLAGAAVATVTTGLYGLVRSSLHLHDRSVHEQSISPTDAEARGSWLNIAASSVGLAAGAASSLLSRSAAAGTNLTKTGQALAVSVEVLRHANIVTGGAGVINSLVHIILKYRTHGEKPTNLELFQFTAATLFFCNAVMANRTAQNIIEDAQAKTINEYRSTLRSNRHRKMFDKVSAESRRVQGAVQGNTEVIRGIKNIIDKDQYFADVLRINKDINQHKLRISMTSDGKVNLNAQHKFNPSELYNIGKEGRAQLFNSLGAADLNAQNVPTRIAPNTAVGRYIDNEEEGGMLVGIHPGEIIRIGHLLVRVSASGAENVALMLENLSQDIYANLMTVSFNILSQLVPDEIARLRLLSPDEDLIVQVVKFVFNYMKHQRPLGDPCRDTDNGIVVVLKEFFQEGMVCQGTILHLKDRLLAWIEEEVDRRREQFPYKKLVICEHCRGVRHDPFEGCSVRNCIFTGNDSSLDTADAVMVHLHTALIPVTKNRNLRQKWIFLDDESPRNSFSMAQKKPKISELINVFNWSMTYRSDADVPVPYGRTVPLYVPVLKPITEIIPNWKIKRRDVLAAILISHCGVFYRMGIIKVLKSVLTIHVHGKCGEDELKASCPGHFRADCKLMSQYLFYIVLENSKCKEYITEKLFYHAYSRGAIPIIQGPSVDDCERLLPPDSYLHIDNYETLDDLANDIIAISKNEERLLSFHKWRYNFEVLNEHGYFGSKSYHLCRLCEAMNYNDMKTSIYGEEELKKFLDQKSLCRENDI